MAGSRKGKRKRRTATYHLNCGSCGGGFSASRYDAVFCSEACRKRDARKTARIELVLSAGPLSKTGRRTGKAVPK